MTFCVIFRDANALAYLRAHRIGLQTCMCAAYTCKVGVCSSRCILLCEKGQQIECYKNNDIVHDVLYVCMPWLCTLVLRLDVEVAGLPSQLAGLSGSAGGWPPGRSPSSLTSIYVCRGLNICFMSYLFWIQTHLKRFASNDADFCHR